jgi:universal stress protein A
MALFRRILVPHDFSDHATRALKTAVELAKASRGRIEVLNVVVPFTPVTALPPAEATAWIPPIELVNDQKRRLEGLVARVVKGRGRPPVGCRVVVGDAYQRIMAAARGADLIVMATAGRTGLSHLLIGSVAEKVVRHSPIPVLTLRAKASRRRARRR